MIGQLRERIGLYRADTEPDGQGGQRQSWSFAFALWAGVEPLGSRESKGGRALRRYRVTVRHRPDIPEPARLQWNSKTYAVLASDDPDLRGQRLHLICEEL